VGGLLCLGALLWLSGRLRRWRRLCLRGLLRRWRRLCLRGLLRRWWRLCLRRRGYLRRRVDVGCSGFLLAAGARTLAVAAAAVRCLTGGYTGGARRRPSVGGGADRDRGGGGGERQCQDGDLDEITRRTNRTSSSAM